MYGSEVKFAACLRKYHESTQILMGEISVRMTGSEIVACSSPTLANGVGSDRGYSNDSSELEKVFALPVEP